VEPELLCTRVGGAEAIAHDPRPQPACGAELRDLFEEVVVRVEEERQALAEGVRLQTAVDARLHVGNAVRERERHLLHGRRSRLADVIAADRNRVPLRRLALAERDDVRGDTQRRTRRVDIRAARDVLLEDVVLNRARHLPRVATLPARHRDVEREQDDGRRVDRHRSRDTIQRDAVEQDRHVFDRIDGDANLADLSRGKRVIGVVADLGRQVERNTQSHDPLRQEVAVSPVRVRGGGEAGVLAHRPRAAAVHRRLNAAGEGERTRRPDIGRGIRVLEVVRRQEGLHVWRF
jgi:hypothetical protein